MPPQPFAISVPDAVLDDLRDRLARTRAGLTPYPARAGSTAPMSTVTELCEYWRTGFDWRAREAELNQYPGFLCEVDGVDLHFWHVRGKGPNPMPLLLVHGWPGSIFEFHHLIGPLTDPAAYGTRLTADVVVPALPGYGFGGQTKERGWGPSRTAAAFDHLMTKELGYARYATQGGDWGGIITARMGGAHGANIIGCHLNFVIAGPPANPSPEDREVADARAKFQAEETAYSQLHGTKPMSSRSPGRFTRKHGRVDRREVRSWAAVTRSVYTKDQLLDIMFTGRRTAPLALRSGRRTHAMFTRCVRLCPCSRDLPGAAKLVEGRFNISTGRSSKGRPAPSTPLADVHASPYSALTPGRLHRAGSYESEPRLRGLVGSWSIARCRKDAAVRVAASQDGSFDVTVLRRDREVRLAGAPPGQTASRRLDAAHGQARSPRSLVPKRPPGRWSSPRPRAVAP
jgi:pimeloyl-ACP methyl ester carboxylesterase